MPQLLTRRKQAWIQTRKPELIRGGVLNNPTVVSAKYQSKLDVLIDRMADEVQTELVRFFHEPHAQQYFAQDASVASQARILTNYLTRRFNKLFADQAPDLADEQANAVDKASSTALHSSLQKLSGGLSLPTTTLAGELTDILSASVTANVALIKSISQQYLTGVQGAVMRSITTGQGLHDLIPFLEKHKGITKRRAAMIAGDQTRKAYNNLNRGRMEKVGLAEFGWLHTGGSQEPRKLHQDYNGRIFRFNDLPVIDEHTGEKGIPGQLINCHCRMFTVLGFGER